MPSQTYLHTTDTLAGQSIGLRARMWFPAVMLVVALLVVGCQNDPDPTTPAAPVPETVATEKSSASETQPEPTAPPATRAQDPMVLPTAIPAPDNFQIPQGVPEDLATVWEVWALLNEQHVDRNDFDTDTFNEAAIRGLVEGTGDPHSGYVPPEAFEIENQDLYGSFEGIGARVEMRPDGKLLIVAPIKGSPAEAAGLKPGDLVLEVNGESIVGLSLLEAVNKIRGPKGSEVRL
ncbi:MAG: PDZ domain-containing protein, partial [Dehalococcoidia bacterium]|nr:PDZ domain-containing protein [Dehalococcoidia bacterium]